MVLLGQVGGLHDVELGDEWVDWMTLLINETGVLEVCSKMELLLDLVLVLEDSIDPALSKQESNG